MSRKERCSRLLVLSVLSVAAVATGLPAAEPFHDRAFRSEVFNGPRHYRIFLPPGYESGTRRYPIIYYCHGHSDRYTLEKYDDGKDTVPKIAAFVAKHDVIVVTVDGYVAEHYTGFYGGSPWDVRINGGDYDFGLYFQELVAHVDKTYRTRSGRRFRATSGLSMGGFMSLYLSGRYPHLIGSASSFNPGPEFFVGDKGRRVLWRPKDHVANHRHTMMRLIRASGDYISQYHEETHAAYANAHEVDYEYRRDEYHRHWATSIAETFDFHVRAFKNPKLDLVPEVFCHANAYREFTVWGYRVQVDGEGRGITYLTDVHKGGLRVTTRRWAPDGPAVADGRISIVTAPLYRPGTTYAMLDLDFETGKTDRSEVKADEEGKITVTTDGAGHQLSFLGPDIAPHVALLLPVSAKDKLRLPPGKVLSLPLRLYNPGGKPLDNVKVALSSEYPTVSWIKKSVTVPLVEAGAVADLSGAIEVRFTAGGGYFAPTRLMVSLSAEGRKTTVQPLDVLVIPEHIPRPAAVEILDGRSRIFRVFRQKGNQGGGSSIEREVSEGKGNGNGILEPGEEATIWVKVVQGLDPFDKNNWHRCKVYAHSPWVTEVADLQDHKQREWTGAKERSSVIRLSEDAPSGVAIPILLDNETWSYHFTPDVRYGRERLYQAFQLHSHHLHEYVLNE